MNKAENFQNALNPNYDLYVRSFICTNFEAFAAFSAIFTRIRLTNLAEKRFTLVAKINWRPGNKLIENHRNELLLHV